MVGESNSLCCCGAGEDTDVACNMHAGKNESGCQGPFQILSVRQLTHKYIFDRYRVAYHSFLIQQEVYGCWLWLIPG